MPSAPGIDADRRDVAPADDAVGVDHEQRALAGPVVARGRRRTAARRRPWARSRPAAGSAACGPARTRRGTRRRRPRCRAAARRARGTPAGSRCRAPSGRRRPGSSRRGRRPGSPGWPRNSDERAPSDRASTAARSRAPSHQEPRTALEVVAATAWDFTPASRTRTRRGRRKRCGPRCARKEALTVLPRSSQANQSPPP